MKKNYAAEQQHCIKITKSIYLDAMFISTWIFVHVCYPISNVFRLNCKSIAAAAIALPQQQQENTHTDTDGKAHIKIRFKHTSHTNEM